MGVQAFNLKWPFLESIQAAQNQRRWLPKTRTLTSTTPAQEQEYEWTVLWNRAIELYRRASSQQSQQQGRLLPQSSPQQRIVLDELTKLIVTLGQCRPNNSNFNNNRKNNNKDTAVTAAAFTPQSIAMMQGALDAIEAQLIVVGVDQRPSSFRRRRSRSNNDDDEEDDPITVLYRAAQCIGRAMDDPNVDSKQIQDLINAYVKVKAQLLLEQSEKIKLLKKQQTKGRTNNSNPLSKLLASSDDDDDDNTVQSLSSSTPTQSSETNEPEGNIGDSNNNKDSAWWNKLWSQQSSSSSSLVAESKTTISSNSLSSKSPTLKSPAVPDQPESSSSSRALTATSPPPAAKRTIVRKTLRNKTAPWDELGAGSTNTAAASRTTKSTTTRTTTSPRSPLLQQPQSPSFQQGASDNPPKTTTTTTMQGEPPSSFSNPSPAPPPQAAAAIKTATPLTQQSSQPFSTPPPPPPPPRRQPSQQPLWQSPINNNLAFQLEQTLLSDTGGEDPVQSFVNALRQQQEQQPVNPTVVASTASFSSATASSPSSSGGAATAGPSSTPVIDTGEITSNVSPTAGIMVESSNNNNATARIERFVESLRSIREGGTATVGATTTTTSSTTTTTLQSNTSTTRTNDSTRQPVVGNQSVNSYVPNGVVKDESNDENTRVDPAVASLMERVQQTLAEPSKSATTTDASSVRSSDPSSQTEESESYQSSTKSTQQESWDEKNNNIPRLTSILQYNDIIPESVQDDNRKVAGILDNDPKEVIKAKLKKLERQMDQYLNDENAWEELATAGEESWDSAKEFWANQASPVVRTGLALAWKQISTAWSVVYRILARETGPWVPRWGLPSSETFTAPQDSSNNETNFILDNVRPEKWKAWARKLSWVDNTGERGASEVVNENTKNNSKRDRDYAELKDASELPAETQPASGEQQVDLSNRKNGNNNAPDWSRLAAEWARRNSEKMSDSPTPATTSTTTNNNNIPSTDSVPSSSRSTSALQGEQDWSRLAKEWAAMNSDDDQDTEQPSSMGFEARRTGTDSDRRTGTDSFGSFSPTNATISDTSSDRQQQRGMMKLDTGSAKSQNGQQRPTNENYHGQMTQQAPLADEWSRRNMDNISEPAKIEGFLNGTDQASLQPPESLNNEGNIGVANGSWLNLADAWKYRNSDEEQENKDVSLEKPEEEDSINKKLGDEGSWQQLANDWAERNRDSSP
ncbi:hypothetical protein ACA910_004016 [Epithemia clementina (nom. ined.)]